MLKPGPRNLITDVDGLLVGNAEDDRLRSGVTVVHGRAPVRRRRSMSAAARRARARPTCSIRPAASTGSMRSVSRAARPIGLSSADGVMRWLRERGRGFGGRRRGRADRARRDPVRPAERRRQGLGLAALSRARPIGRPARAARDFALGNAGAGLGAKAGNLKGGLGSASAVDPATGLQVGALVAVNSRGYTTMGGMPQFWAWALEQDGEFGGLPPPRLASRSRCRTIAPTSRTIRRMPRAAIRAPTPPSPWWRPTRGSTRRRPSGWR